MEEKELEKRLEEQREELLEKGFEKIKEVAFKMKEVGIFLARNKSRSDALFCAEKLAEVGFYGSARDIAKIAGDEEAAQRYLAGYISYFTDLRMLPPD